jgi:class 3 adenylate cyclase/tetratricopeptide (TPR) repeat protein
MSFLETVERAKVALERNRRVSVQGLKREFDLDSTALEELVSELVDVQQVATLEGRVLSWRPGGLEDHVSSPGARAERRQLTVMFCDLVGSTALSERLDAEDLRDVMSAYQECASHAIARYQGHIGQYLGDGLLIYFGYPLAHEDDAECAVRAGLAILRALETLNEKLELEAGIRLAVRIGIHTGAVVVGEVVGGGGETQVLGATTNIAARLMSVADPGSVVISGATLRLIPGRFRTQDLGIPVLKGIAEPIRAFSVLHATPARTRLDVDPSRLTQLVGRDRELGILLDCWDQATKGEVSALLISGEAGVGKSRLLRALGERIADEPHTLIECQCARDTQGSAFHPLIEVVERSLGCEAGDAPEDKLQRLEAAVERARLPVPEVLPLLASVLSLPVSDRHPPLEFSPELRRKKTIEALGALFLALAEGQPLLMLVEDLQWCDPSTLEFLTVLLERPPAASLLILLSFRADFEPPEWLRLHVEHLVVPRLGARHAEQLIKEMTRGLTLPREVREQIVERADGVPLFLEELTKMVLESGLAQSSERPGQPAALAIPSTLQDSLMARLDRLGRGKEVAQLGAVLGRQFSYELLRAVSRTGDAELADGLEALIDAELLLAKGTPPRATYKFSHALIQETAYHSLLRSERRRLQAETANVLVERFPERAATEPEVVARLYQQAGLAEQAIAYYRQAARRASRQSASEEAIAHLRRALEILETLPERPERNRLELELQLSIGVPLYVTRGWANAEYGQRLERARVLATEVGDAAEVFHVWMGLYTHHQVAGRLANAEDCARRALELAHPIEGHRDHLSARAGLSQTLYLQGEFVAALEHLEEAVALFGDVGGRHLHLVDSARALCRWTLGYPDQALELCNATLASAQAVGPPFELASAYIYSGWILQKRGEHTAALTRAEEAIDLCERLGFSWLPWAIALRGSVRVEHGARNVAEIQAGIDSLKSAGTKGWLPHCFGVLAEALWKVERHTDALRAIARGLECAEETGQRYEDSELLRLQGAILFAGGETGAAEKAFEAALKTAQRQQAKSLELRAATSLARLWQNQGRNAQAHALLAPVHRWFSQGFETRDWKEAETLLAELARNAST